MVALRRTASTLAPSLTFACVQTVVISIPSGSVVDEIVCTLNLVNGAFSSDQLESKTAVNSGHTSGQYGAIGLYTSELDKCACETRASWHCRLESILEDILHVFN